MNDSPARVRVLIIDDEPVIRDITSDFLRHFHFEVGTAENGRKGLELIETWHPDAVICDLTMPDMGGLAVLDQVSGKYPDLPFIVFSGNGNINDAVGALKKGAWDYLLKPLTNLSLISHTLERAFERRNLLLATKNYHARLEDEVKQRTFELMEQIQQQKRTEELLRVSLTEKEVLLSEVHHRVKNNLQIILSLLDMQTERIHDSEARALLQETMGRVQAMALIHERLFDHEGVDRVEISEYLSDVGNSLLASLDLYRKVRIRVEAGGFFLNATRAFPAGLLMNEILAGVLKHRPQGQEDGHILVASIPDEPAALVVTDTFGGLGRWLADTGSDSFGRVLLDILAGQARAQWHYDLVSETLRLDFSAV